MTRRLAAVNNLAGPRWIRRAQLKWVGVFGAVRLDRPCPRVLDRVSGNLPGTEPKGTGTSGVRPGRHMRYMTKFTASVTFVSLGGTPTPGLSAVLKPVLYGKRLSRPVAGTVVQVSVVDPALDVVVLLMISCTHS